MKTDVTTYGALLQSQARTPVGKGKVASKAAPAMIDPKLLKNESPPAPDYKLDLSKPATLPPLPSLPTPDLPVPDLAKPKLPENRPGEIKKPSEIKVEEVKDGPLKKPAIIFIKGLDVFSSPLTSETGYAGLGKIAESIEGSRLYGWDQHKDILSQIKKVEATQPVVLVGHSLGGDTALEIAEALDSLEHGFRKVDLLITIDSVGMDNDIIPQNVKNHLNVFGESNFLLNDGPHVARRNELTQVKNILSPYDHTELDDDKEIQFEVVNLIKNTLSKKA